MEIGIDAGVGNIKLVFIENNKVKEFRTERTEGSPIEKISSLLRDVRNKHSLGITGAEGKVVSNLPNSVNYVNHAVAVLTGFQKFYPDARTVFDIGRENSSYYHFADNHGLVLEDFATNSVCGAGGGALIEKMTTRLQFSSLDEFVEQAFSAESVAKIAGRCGVFAESDVVHHYQKGTPTESIVAGLCQMLARNFWMNVIQNRSLIEPIYMIGGVSKNKAVVSFLEQLINKKIIIPDNQHLIKAFGAAKFGLEVDIQEFLTRLNMTNIAGTIVVTCPLRLEKSKIDSRPYEILRETGEDKVILSLNNYEFPSEMKCFLGLDVGSVSTKSAVLDENGRFVFGIYRRTSGKPIDAVRDVIIETGQYLEKRTRAEILGAGVTGSGRDLAGKFGGADVVANEITAQARGAAFFVPDVDTIFEIGGQDSKYIHMEKGEVTDNMMNKACAASTGSFLEEQARILGINIEEQFAELALKSQSPCGLSEKCAILMASSLAHYRDSPIEDKCAGLAKSVCENYLNRVVGRNRIGDNIVFQGAVAFNNSIVAAFETLLNKKIYVPEFPHLTGAIGIADIVRETYQEASKK